MSSLQAATVMPARRLRGRLRVPGDKSIAHRYAILAALAEGRSPLSGREGTFNMCSFWLVEALTRAGRSDPARLEDARLLFEQMLGYANHLGRAPRFRRSDRRHRLQDRARPDHD